MAVDAKIVGGANNRTVNVTPQGALVVDALAFDEAFFNELAVDDTAYNFYGPKAHHQFIIRGMLAFADRDINDASDTVVVVYEASSASTTTEDKILFQFGMARLSTLPLVPLNLLVNEGKYINAKTSDDDVHMTIMGHYVPVTD